MSRDFFEETTQPPNEVYMRLLDIQVSTLDDEQIQKTRAKFPDIAVQPTLKITYEPLSYSIDGRYGNLQTDYIPMTFSTRSLDWVRDKDGAVTPTPEVLAAVREHGFDGIPPKDMIKTPRGNDPKKLERYYERWMIHFRNAGFSLRVNDGEVDDRPIGQLYTPEAGAVVRVLEGTDEFPEFDVEAKKWTTTTKSKYVRYIVGAAPEYVAPEEVPVRRFAVEEVKDPPTTAGTSVTSEQLKTAVEAAGWVGQPVEAFEGPNKQIAMLSRGITADAEAAPLADETVQIAAREGNLLGYLEEAGVIAGGVNIVVAG